MKKYSEEVKTFIAENVKGITAKDLAQLVNDQFGTEFTEAKMKTYKTNHKLKSGTPRGLPAGHPTKEFPQEVQGFIFDNYHGVGPKEMAVRLNTEFSASYTYAQFKAYYKNHKLNSGLKGYFPKGHVPANKGKKGICYEGSKGTQFKKGIKPHNYKHVGAERVNGDGYVDIKIADPNKWRGKHILIWEEANGPLPEGYVVIFGDGNKRNFALDNLLFVSRAQLVRLNKGNLIQNDAELTRTGIIIADLQNKIGERKRRGRLK